MQNLMWVPCSTCSAILNAGHTVHMLTQQHLLPSLTSTVKSLFTRAHSSPLSLAARLHHVMQTVPVILTMAGRFPDRPCMLYKGCCSGFTRTEWEW